VKQEGQEQARSRGNVQGVTVSGPDEKAITMMIKKKWRRIVRTKKQKAKKVKEVIQGTRNTIEQLLPIVQFRDFVLAALP